MQDILNRLEILHKTAPYLRAYALVDGLQYQQHTSTEIEPIEGVNVALFKGTPEESLAHAGQWLVDVLNAPRALATDLDKLDKARPSVVWVIDGKPQDDLAAGLRSRLEITLPDGRSGLLRFYDPRVLVGLAQTLEQQQREEFLGIAEEWHFYYQGRRARIGRA